MATVNVTRVFTLGDPHPIILKLTPLQVAARIQEAKVIAEKHGISEGFATFKGSFGPILVRPSAVASIVPGTMEVEDDD